MMDSELNPPKLTLGHLLGNVSRLVGGRMRMKLEEIGLHHAQGLILFHLWREDGIAQKVLAQALHITPPTATNTLQRMERDGWIQRRRDAIDQRVVRVYLTQRSRTLREEARNSFRELDQELTAVLSQDERNILVASLSKVRQYLLQAIKTPDRACPGQAGPGDESKESL
jgi:DNA-binding MarR family transcriptional regulator